MAIVPGVATDAQQDAGRGACSPCGGTGKVISSLGGEAREVTFPWCEGSGRFAPGHDAQNVSAHSADSPASRPDAGLPA